MEEIRENAEQIVLENYCKEITSIDRKFNNGISIGKREKLVYRKKDIIERLIPKLFKRY